LDKPKQTKAIVVNLKGLFLGDFFKLWLLATNRSKAVQLPLLGRRDDDHSEAASYWFRLLSTTLVSR
jgi:hypothetical protein